MAAPSGPHWGLLIHVIDKDWASLDQWLLTVSLCARQSAPITPGEKAQPNQYLAGKLELLHWIGRLMDPLFPSTMKTNQWHSCLFYISLYQI